MCLFDVCVWCCLFVVFLYVLAYVCACVRLVVCLFDLSCPRKWSCDLMPRSSLLVLCLLLALFVLLGLFWFAGVVRYVCHNCFVLCACLFGVLLLCVV